MAERHHSWLTTLGVLVLILGGLWLLWLVGLVIVDALVLN